MTKVLTKAQLVSQLALESSLDKRTIESVLLALNTVTTREVQAGGGITLPGMVKIICRDQPERMVRNPATGEKLQKPASRKVAATVLKVLKDAL